MKATALEFRFRMWVIAAIVCLGFWAPWIEWTERLGLGTRTRAWLWLGFELGGLGIPSTHGFELVTMLAIAVAAAAAALRVWGTAYLGAGTVTSAEMQAGRVMADGPYRRVRNPLYMGNWLMVAAISVLMPPTGALFTMVVLTVFLFRIILGEEAFLAARLGEPYAGYCRAVPRILPSFRARVAASGRRASWGRAVLSEIMPLGVLGSFAVLSWDYNANLLMRAVLVSFGISLVVRAALAPQAAQM